MARASSVVGALASMLLMSTASAACPDLKDLDLSLFVMNFQSPLISAQLADHIAWEFFQSRYHGGDIFEAKQPAEIADLGDRWGVTFQNALFEPPVDLAKRLQVRALGVEICKSNGAIFRIK